MDLIKERMVALEPLLDSVDMRLLANKHDELLMDGPLEVIQDPEIQGMVKSCLESPSISFDVPIRWEMGTSENNWAEAKP